jgi:hypothetical protein
MPIDTSVPLSDGWWLEQCYIQLRDQAKACQNHWERYIGNPPMPALSPNQRDAVKWFISKARTNFERLIVAAVLSRLRIRGIRTAVDDDEGGDADAFKIWRGTRGKLWSLEVHKYMLAMGRGYVIVGKNDKGKLLVTAEDPRMVTAIVDPADPFKVHAALKLVFDPIHQEDVAYLYLPGRIMIARRSRSVSMPTDPVNTFHPQAFDWAVNLDDAGNFTADSESNTVDWLQGNDDEDPLCPVVPFFNTDGMAEFEPHVELLDRISQQILQRMTIATVQAFKQRAMKGLPRKDPETGQEIDYTDVFTADPAAVWNLPESVEIWESGAVDLQPILLAIRDDVKDLAAVSGTPLYTVTPDVANGSAEGASLQRETLTFKVEERQDLTDVPHGVVVELIFRTLGDAERSKPGTAEIMWAPADRPSMAERANAIAQTKGVVPRYQQLVDIWGMDPAQADRAMTQLQTDMAIDQAMANAAGGGGPARPPGAPGGAPGPNNTRQLRPAPPGAPPRAKGVPDMTRGITGRQNGPQGAGGAS